MWLLMENHNGEENKCFTTAVCVSSWPYSSGNMRGRVSVCVLVFEYGSALFDE